jgi:hypothetical protein
MSTGADELHPLRLLPRNTWRRPLMLSWQPHRWAAACGGVA